MREFGYALGDQPGLDEVARTDLLLDALAERAGVRLGDPDDDALAALLGDWRDDLRWPPASALVSQDEATEALIAGMTERRRARRGLAAVGSVAATLLALSGFGAVVADARPGDALYGLHKMMFDEPRVNDDQIVLSAKADLAKVEQMIAQGQWSQAQTQLAEVSSTLQAVNDGSRRQDLLAEVNQLNTKVEKRDPNAEAPAPASEVTSPAPTPASTSPRAATPSTTSPASTTSPSAAMTTSPTTSPTTTTTRTKKPKSSASSTAPKVTPTSPTPPTSAVAPPATTTPPA
ncbi:anti-sigma-D factor RsdA [Mycobacterium szulgai]|uniref:Anti-sigma-D factor RsdA sigma factor binding region domain-containing protein n=1 Tax=Mycobacterium szulgai TaxID=1787 RepID=A0A1X2DXB1_MYCSZ|nr:anti-sigma-D factor RsdA [Mycobacterium szulgai]MCV7075262.1 hypothetical protein [Mycobacterium szulgai]ORW92771.1 hypothetical protein AWC27_08580 [Mycobacterium szulgai]